VSTLALHSAPCTPAATTLEPDTAGAQLVVLQEQVPPNAPFPLTFLLPAAAGAGLNTADGDAIMSVRGATFKRTNNEEGLSLMKKK
jgi:hypothetical protein